MTTNASKSSLSVEARICRLDPFLAKMEAGETSAVTDAARTARRALHALLDTIVTDDIAESDKVEVDRFIAQHGRPPSWAINPADHSADIAF